MTVAVRGMAWSFAGRFAVKAVQFGFGVVLARLLCPSDFGLVGMIAIFIALSEILADCGFGAALVRKCDRNEDDYATVFWFKLALASVAYAALFAAAPFIAKFYGEPLLVPLTRLVSIGVVLSAAASVAYLRLQVGLQFRKMALLSFAGIVLSGAVGIVCAWRGLGVWAVVSQGLSWHLVNVMLQFGAARWLPAMRFSMVSFRSLYDFGWKHLMRGVIDAVYNNGYALVIGKSFGAADLGLYNRADYYTAEVGATVGGVANEVNYPILSQLQGESAKLRRSYFRLQLLVAAVMVPGMAVLVVFAEPIVRFVIGAQWLGCVPYLRILAVGAAFAPLAGLAYLPMYVKNRPDLVLKTELVMKSATFALLFAAIPFGILAICVVKSLSSVVTFVVSATVARRTLGAGQA